MKSTQNTEVTAICNACKDIFDVTLNNRRGEIHIEPSRAIGYVNGNLVHRPGHCNGTVRILARERTYA